jgi:RHS repeat-associated protein
MIRRKRGGEELYVLKDYLDPAAIIDTGGNVVERFGYDAFGPASFMAPDFTPRPSSAADWNFLFHAEFLDEDTGLYNYGYRYYNPELGRWPSRDPIGPNFITGELNDYAFIKNLGLNAIDYLGLTVISGNVDEVGGNCLGGAVMNDGGVYLQPNHKSEKNQSFKEALEKDFGLKCTEHKEAKDCNCKCNEEKILITLYKNDDPKNKGKNPWNDPKFEWNFDSKGKPLSDIHAIRADRGCDRNYKQIPRFQRGIPGQAGFNKNIDWDLFKDKPLLCCCYKKK